MHLLEANQELPECGCGHAPCPLPMPANWGLPEGQLGQGVHASAQKQTGALQQCCIGHRTWFPVPLVECGLRLVPKGKVMDHLASTLIISKYIRHSSSSKMIRFPFSKPCALPLALPCFIASGASNHLPHHIKVIAWRLHISKSSPIYMYVTQRFSRFMCQPSDIGSQTGHGRLEVCLWVG